MADNPGPFTFKGTMSYIIGRGHVAIVDPGPADERHIGALLDAVRSILTNSANGISFVSGGMALSFGPSNIVLGDGAFTGAPVAYK